MLNVCFTEMQPEKEKWKSFLVALLHRKVNGKQWKGKNGRINWDCLQQEAYCHIKHPNHGFSTDFNCIFLDAFLLRRKHHWICLKKWTCLLGNPQLFIRKITITLLYVTCFCFILMRTFGQAIRILNLKPDHTHLTWTTHTHTQKFCVRNLLLLQAGDRSVVRFHFRASSLQQLHQRLGHSTRSYIE